MAWPIHGAVLHSLKHIINRWFVTSIWKWNGEYDSSIHFQNQNCTVAIVVVVVSFQSLSILTSSQTSQLLQHHTNKVSLVAESKLARCKRHTFEAKQFSKKKFHRKHFVFISFSASWHAHNCHLAISFDTVISHISIVSWIGSAKLTDHSKRYWKRWTAILSMRYHFISISKWWIHERNGHWLKVQQPDNNSILRKPIYIHPKSIKIW